MDRQYTRTMISARSPQNKETEYYKSQSTDDVTRIIDQRIVKYWDTSWNRLKRVNKTQQTLMSIRSVDSPKRRIRIEITKFRRVSSLILER